MRSRSSKQRCSNSADAASFEHGPNVDDVFARVKTLSSDVVLVVDQKAWDAALRRHRTAIKPALLHATVCKPGRRPSLAHELLGTERQTKRYSAGGAKGMAGHRVRTTEGGDTC